MNYYGTHNSRAWHMIFVFVIIYPPPCLSTAPCDIHHKMLSKISTSKSNITIMRYSSTPQNRNNNYINTFTTGMDQPNFRHSTYLHHSDNVNEMEPPVSLEREQTHTHTQPFKSGNVKFNRHHTITERWGSKPATRRECDKYSLVDCAWAQKPSEFFHLLLVVYKLCK